ncbi:hypothetical protein MTR67_023225 [Solanum verrucosum]|uniref:Integrase zinc-binding domain-containing protein n=1 Tax=Solanum verrucosum TaxID=315347 RepID=A0AAF0QW24_SOLVR|nr:hypothetical protein MTR67_023225 [Solanum verrucosum]
MGGVMVRNASKSSFVKDVKSKKYLDPILVELKQSVLKKSVEGFSQGEDGVLRYEDQLCVPDVDGLREKILEEAHISWYSSHPGATKMYRDLREVYWWKYMKKDIAIFVAKCPNCQQFKGYSIYFTLLEVIQKGLGTKVMLNMTFHPQTDGQAERTIQTLEDMLWACVIDFKGDVGLWLFGLRWVKLL